MIFPLTIVSAVACWLYAHRRHPRSGIAFGMAVWAFGAIFAAVPLWDFQVAYSLEVDALVAAWLVCVVVGYSSVRARPVTAPAKGHYSRAGSDETVGYALALLGALGGMLLVVAAVQKGVSLNPALLDLSAVREESFTSAQQASAGPVQMLGTFLAPCSYLFLVFAYRMNRTRLLVALWIFNLVVIAGAGLLLYGGRQTIFTALLLAFVGLYLRGVKLFKLDVRGVAVSLLMAGVGWYALTAFASSRQENDPALLMHDVAHAEFGALTRDAAAKSDEVGNAVFQASYFAQPLPNFLYWMNQSDRPGPYLGAYSYQLPSAVYRTALGFAAGAAPGQPWQETREEIFEPYEREGYLGNVWPTVLRDLVADFGRWGALLFGALLGAWMAWCRNRYETSGGALHHVLETMSATVLGFGAFQSLLYPDYMGYGFLYALGLLTAQFALVIAPSVGVAARRPA